MNEVTDHIEGTPADVTTVPAIENAAAVKASAPVAPKAKRASKPRAKAVAAPVVVAVRKTNRKAAVTVAKRKYVRKAPLNTAPKSVAAPVSTPLFKGSKIMDATNAFAGLTQIPGADKFQTLFADAGAKSQDAVRKTQAFAEQLTEAGKANVEAVVESSRIVAAGARDLGTEIVATTKSSVEQATAAVKSLTEAKSPTEFFQLQSELLRSSFDRMVADGSKLTEQLVKFAGEAVQPLSNRASVNAEKFSELTA